MPFPLAHPAAILPLRRWCPRYLDFSALVVGSLTPDLATFIDDWEYFSHTIAGSFVFCLPVGLLTFWVFHRVRRPLVSTFPNPHRATLLPLCASHPNSFFPVILSLVVGSWLHIVWDLFTHDHSWLRFQIPFLFLRVAGLPLNQLIWLLSSLSGSVVLVATYLSLLQKRGVSWWHVPATERRAYARWFCIFILPLAGSIPLALHDLRHTLAMGSLARYLAMYYLGCAYLTLAVTGFFFKFRMSEENH